MFQKLNQYQLKSNTNTNKSANAKHYHALSDDCVVKGECLFDHKARVDIKG